jgi:hypothetical protein
MSSCKNSYCNYGSYLRSRGFDAEICDIKNSINNISDLNSGGTINGDLDMCCNNINSINEITFCNGKTFDGTVTFDLIGDLDLCCNNINNVNNITFCDGTYIGPGTSFDISTNQDLSIKQNSNETLRIDISGDFYFNSTNRLSFRDMSSNYQNVELPTIHTQPISLSRLTIFRNDISYNIPKGDTILTNFNDTIVNQLNLGISGSNNEFISPSIDISGQMIEIYTNILVETDNNDSAIEFDISSVEGVNFFEEIGSTNVEGKNNQYYLTFGPHMFIPDEWQGSTKFVFKLTNTSQNNAINIIEQKIIFKAYFV